MARDRGDRDAPIVGTQSGDRPTQREDRLPSATWLVLLACLVSAGNAMIRYAFSYTSNGWLEAQWYMFAILVMFGASYTFKRNEHVRVEILYLMLSERGQLWLDLIGTLFFLIPSCLLLAYLSWPFFYQAYAVGRDERQCRRPAALADQVRYPVRLRDAGVARRLRGDQADRGAAGLCDHRREVLRGRRNDHAGDDAAADVRRPDRCDADRLSGGVHARRGRPVVRVPVDLSRLLRPQLPAGDPGPHLRQRAVQRAVARDPVLHLHGRDIGDDAASPRTCWIRWASCSARSAAASAIP